MRLKEASSVLLAARRRRLLHQLRWRLRGAVWRLDRDCSLLAEVLVEVLEIAEEANE